MLVFWDTVRFAINQHGETSQFILTTSQRFDSTVPKDNVIHAKELEDATRNLIISRDKINFDKMKESSFLMILTSTEFSYKRDDGVYITPIGSLKD